MQVQTKLGDLLYPLLEVDHEAWGMYAFRRDILNRRIPAEAKREMLKRARACGIAYAQRMMLEYGTRDVRVLAGRMGLKLEMKDALMTGKRVLFASYTPPDRIEIMEEPLRRAAEQVREAGPGLVELFPQAGIMNTILGHEIYHFVEDRFAQEIYTRTERILLWKLMGLKNYSTIRTLSEVGAMAFTQELNRLRYSPFILDVLLYYSYDATSAETITRDVLGVSSGKV